MIDQQRLTAMRKQYGKRASVQVRITNEEFAELIANGCPPDLLAVRDKAAGRVPTHILLRFPQLQSLLNHAEQSSQAAEGDHSTTDISGLPEAGLADQIDGGSDRPSAGTDEDRPSS